MLAYCRRASLQKLADAMKAGYRTTTEVAEYMDVTEEFLTAAIEEYRAKYGQYVKVGDDWLMLEPTVGLVKRVK